MNSRSPDSRKIEVGIFSTFSTVYGNSNFFLNDQPNINRIYFFPSLAKGHFLPNYEKNTVKFSTYLSNH